MQLEDAEQLALALLAEHGLQGWTFSFDRAKRRLGACNYTSRTISLSRPLTRLNSEAVVRDTLLHEIAHALTPGGGHGPAWRAKCLELGVAPQRCFAAAEVVTPEPKYLLECPACGKGYPRHRKTRTRYVCRACCARHNAGRPSTAYLLRWKRAA